MTIFIKNIHPIFQTNLDTAVRYANYQVGKAHSSNYALSGLNFLFRFFKVSDDGNSDSYVLF